MNKKITDSKVKWGIIGVGDVCEVKSAPAMQIIEGSELVAVMRRNGEKAQDYASRHKVPKWYDDANKLIQDPDINAIYIATPPNAHESYTIQAAAAGKPIYVEKPMALNFQECQQMITACEQVNVPLYVAYYRRALPNFLKIKALIDAGEIGDIRLVRIDLYKTIEPDIIANTLASIPQNWRINPAISGGGYFFDLAAHQFDFLDYLLGPIESVSGVAANQANLYSAADIITTHFTFANGTQGVGSWCFTVDDCAAKDELTIIGSKGQIRIPFFGTPEVIVEKSGQVTAEVFQFDMPKHIQEPLIQTVVDDLLGTGVCESTGETAARTNWVMEEITGAFYNRSHPEF